MAQGPQTIPQQRVIQKLDEYMSRRDYAAVERHLRYWLDEAVALGDARGQLMVRNEMVGHFRKVGDREQALHHVDEALKLVRELGFENTMSAGTTYTNSATACNAFGEHERSLELFRMASQAYEGASQVDGQLLGGLYNNMALTCVALGRFDEADELYAKALATMQQVEHGQLEQAITYLNMADALVARAKAEGGGADPGAAGWPEGCEDQVDAYVDKASELLDDPALPRDGYYAFVCEKCAPVFGYYGYFLVERELRERAQAIYERD